MDIVIVIVFLILGIAFLLFEIFFLPGLSFGAIFGIGFIVASVWYAFGVIGTTAGWITLLGGIVAFKIALWGFLKSRTLEKISLNTEIEGKASESVTDSVKVGDRGITLSRLAPIGKIRIGNKTHEAKSFEGLIDPECQVIVVSTANHSIQVRPLHEEV